MAKNSLIKPVFFSLLLSDLLSMICDAKHEQWETFDEDILNKESILFPDGEGNPVNISLKPNLEIQMKIFTPIEIKYVLYTRSNKDKSQLVFLDKEKTKLNPNFMKSTNTKIIIHGWKSNVTESVVILIKNALLSTMNVNVIGVDWSDVTSRNYIAARLLMDYASDCVGKFINKLINISNITVDHLHLVGHSLGAHLAGMSSRKIKIGKPKMLTGLDPALPLFSVNFPKNRIDSSNAKYVEVIHSNGGLLGFMAPLGHADIYLNGGLIQTGCGYDLVGSCAHKRAYEVYAEMIKSPESFKITHCSALSEVKHEKCQSVSRFVSFRKRARMYGLFNIKTSGNPPYFI